MNLLIYFCIPLVVTGRVTRGTYGREDENSDEIEDDSRSSVTIVDTVASPQTSETYANFYPGHIDYENPELKEYAVDHQDGTYYRKGVGEAAVLTKPALLGGKGRGQAGHPSHIATDIYNSLRGKNVGPVEAGPAPGHGLPAGLAGLDPRYAALLAAQYGQGHAQKSSPLAVGPLAYSAAYPQEYSQSPVGPFAQYAPASVGGRHHHHQHLGLFGPGPYSLYQAPLNPYYASRGAPGGGLAYAPDALAHHHRHHAEDEQLSVAQHVVPTLQVPLVKTAGVPLYTTPVLKTAVPQQVLLKSPIPLVPAYQQPSLLKETALLKSSPHVLLNSGGSVPLYQHLLKAPLVHQPVLQATVGGGLPTPLLKTAPGVEATIVPAIEEHVPEFGPAPVIAKAAAPVHPQYFSAQGLYFAPNPNKVLLQKSLIRKPAVFTEKAVLKAAVAPAYHHDPTKAVIKAPLISHYVQQGGHGHLEPGLSAKILSSQKGLVNALISSDSKKGLRGLAPAHVELLPSLSYGYSYSMYPNEKGIYGPVGPLGHHDHHHAQHHHQEDAHHHEHGQHKDIHHHDHHHH